MRPLLRLFLLILMAVVAGLFWPSLQAQQVPQAGASGAQAERLSQQLSSEINADLASGRFADAEAALLKLNTLHPGVAEIQANLGAVYFQEGKFEAAADSLRHAVRLKPTLARSKTLLAISLAEMGHSAEALPGLETCFRTSPDPEIKRRCGLELLRVYTALQRDADAVTTALALNKAFPDDGEILYQTGRIYGNFAYITMERLRDRAPNSVWMLQGSAEARESEQKYDGAIENYQAVLRLEPRRPGVHYRMGRVYLSQFAATRDEKYRKLAEEQFHAELEIDADNGNAAYELAQIHHDTGELEQSRQEFEALVKARPDFEQAQVGLAGVLIESHQPELAVPPLRQAIALDPNDEVAWYRLGRALRMVGDVAGQKKALAEFSRLHALENGRLARAGILAPAGEVTPQEVGPNQEN